MPLDPFLLLSLGSVLLFVVVTIVAYGLTRRGGLLLILAGVLVWPVAFASILVYVWVQATLDADGFSTPPRALFHVGSIVGVLIMIEGVRRLGSRPHG